MSLSSQSMGNLQKALAKRRTFWTGFALFILVLILFWPAAGFEFTSFDDPHYITENMMVMNGLSWDGLHQAFQVFDEEYWIPLLWISYMFDTLLFGKSAVGFHITNIFLHALNSALLYILFTWVSGRHRLALISAAIFALHPLRVESVAWIVERKGLLSSSFILLGLLAYVVWVKDRRYSQYIFIVAAYLCSLMTKPFLVTFPLLLFILDLWPLERWELRNGANHWNPLPDNWKSLVLEKTPIFLIGGIFAILTLTTQAQRIHSWEGSASIVTRLGRGSLSYFIYLRDLIMPMKLGVRFYDSAASTISPLVSLTSVLALFMLTAIIIHTGRKYQPALLCGWLWYLVSLLPVSGLIPVGLQWTADRFTYIPHTFLVFGVAVTIDAMLEGHKYRKAALLLIVMIVGLLAGPTRQQLTHWKDAVAVASRSVELSPLNLHGNLLLAGAYFESDMARSMKIYERMVAHYPERAESHYHLAIALMEANQGLTAAEHFKVVLQQDPGNHRVNFLLAEILYDVGDHIQAALHYNEVLRIKPDYRAADYVHNQLGLIARFSGKDIAAEKRFQAAVTESPFNHIYHYNLALTLSNMGKNEEAAHHYEKALTLEPDDHAIRFMYAEHLKLVGEHGKATGQYEELIKKLPDTAEEHFAKGRLAEINENPALALKEYNEGSNLESMYPEIKAGLQQSIQSLSKTIK